ncbi:hypothetical protein CHGG_00465 [Chaetomium globosum CBS 148.51]|uniref:Protein SQS1 n=1 Tax=Chaetomium globosum (strain ATCC 6205 / CBS 148.51 / DSM 1962 / NBRC 6347 / NRRL 1970) TaxID=306901 RepID=Q2HH39_CHAGB|nr:uncharacterized protein CHGG_00465 [Chaetomium globosum CBS 148.51]EAQ92230.1 hypothetical protein CHGG_00465 [Chaetomium globosum CBS 148.51]
MPPRRGKWPSPGPKSSRGRPAAHRGKLRDFLPATANTGFQSNGFSMKDEAKHTASHQFSSLWGSGDAQLRQKPVTFVSAGVVEPLKEARPSDDAPAALTPEGSFRDPTEGTSGTVEVENADTQTGAIHVETSTESTLETMRQETTMAEPLTQKQSIDNLGKQLKTPVNETAGLFFFDLAEDEPMMDHTVPPPKIPSPRSSFSGSDSSEEVILFKGRTANGHATAQKNKVISPSSMTALSTELTQHKSETIVGARSPIPRAVAHPTRSSRGRPRPRKKRSRIPKALDNGDEDEDAILADYIDNMAADSDNDYIESQFQFAAGRRDLGGDDDAVNFGFSNDKSPMDDDVLNEEGEECRGSDLSDADVDDLVNWDDGQKDSEADMDDETLARLLAKQEELGLGGDDLLLYSGSFVNNDNKTASRKRPVRAGTSRGVREPASATQVADALDNLDLADWGQLTGQTRKRRSKQPPHFAVSDSEIEATLNTAWLRDRERKKSRKLEREALRAKGLLGKNVDPDDLRVKYMSGMKLDDMKLELTSFLLGSAERLDFPPLDKHARKILHELANKFKVKSQSIGKGDQRRPVLYRTNRTVRYTSTRAEDATSHVNQAASHIHRKYFHRVDLKGPRTEFPRNTGGDRSGHKALALQEGEIVGGSVPELGQENKGRNMLEKMGWSKGMSLGALDNQGILEPVAQVMKRSKAGLG